MKHKVLSLTRKQERVGDLEGEGVHGARSNPVLGPVSLIFHLGIKERALGSVLVFNTETQTPQVLRAGQYIRMEHLEDSFRLFLVAPVSS